MRIQITIDCITFNYFIIIIISSDFPLFVKLSKSYLIINIVKKDTMILHYILNEMARLQYVEILIFSLPNFF